MNKDNFNMADGAPEDGGDRFNFRLSAAKEILAAGESMEEDLIRSRLPLARLYRWVRIAGIGMKYGSTGLFREARFMLIGSAGQDGLARAEAVQVAAGSVSPTYLAQTASGSGGGGPLRRFLNRKSKKLEGAEAYPS